MKRDDRVDHSLCFFFLRRSEISCFCIKEFDQLQAFEVESGQDSRSVCVCVRLTERQIVFCYLS